MESVISDLSEHRENFHVVRLNGFIHTDDKLALKEIWRQLGREMEVEEDGKVMVHFMVFKVLVLTISRSTLPIFWHPYSHFYRILLKSRESKMRRLLSLLFSYLMNLTFLQLTLAKLFSTTCLTLPRQERHRL